jgi:hypothetical protein
MKTKQYILIISALCLAFTISNAQETKKLELGINGFYGISGLSGSVTNGSISPGLGYQLSIDGKFFFLKNLGLGIGIGYATYTSQGELETYASNTPAIDDVGESFEYRVTASGFKEKFDLSAIEIPVFLTFGKSRTGKFGLQANAGLKVSLPITATYQCTEGALETSGYYVSNNVLYANMPNHGFETIDKVSYSGKLSTNMAYSLFGSLGINIPIGKMGLNLGVYGSYGLNSILKPTSKLLIDYPGNYNSLSSLSEKISLLSAGVRIGVSL